MRMKKMVAGLLLAVLSAESAAPAMVFAAEIPTYVPEKYVFENADHGNFVFNLFYTADGIGVADFQGTGALESCYWPVRTDVVIVGEGITELGERQFSEYYFGNDACKLFILPSTLEVIGKSAFEGNGYIPGLENIPENVTTIGDRAFYITGNEEYNIPKKTTSIGDEAFVSSNLKNIFVDSENTVFSDMDGVLMNDDCTELICYPIGRTAKSYTIPDGVTEIKSYAFEMLNSDMETKTELQSIVIPASVTKIGKNAISYWSFWDQKYYNVSDFTIYGYPDTAAETYANDNGYTFVALDEKNSGKCGENLTWHMEGNTLYISGTGDMDDYDNYAKEFTGMILPQTKDIPWESQWEEIHSIVIEDGVESVGNFAFYGLPYLESVSWTDSLKSIGDYAFGAALPEDESTGIKPVAFDDLPKNLESIGDGAFFWRNMQDIKLPETLRSVGAAAFVSYHNPDAKSVTIPDTVNDIGDYAFGGELNPEYYEEYMSSNAIDNAIYFKDSAIGDYLISIENFTVYGSTGSTAETYAKNNGFAFIEVPEESVYGDFNHDGKVDAIDATVILQYAAEYGAGAFTGSFEEYIH